MNWCECEIFCITTTKYTGTTNQLFLFTTTHCHSQFSFICELSLLAGCFSYFYVLFKGLVYSAPVTNGGSTGKGGNALENLLRKKLILSLS